MTTSKLPVYAPGVAYVSLTSVFLVKLARKGDASARAELAYRMLTSHTINA